MAALNRSLTSFYRGVTADTKALADALPPLPETADELRAVAKILGASSEDIELEEAASVTTVKNRSTEQLSGGIFRDSCAGRGRGREVC